MTTEIDTTITHTADSLAAGAAEEGNWILHHVQDSPYLDFAPFGTIPLPHIELFGFDLSITKHVVFMWLGALLLLLAAFYVRGKYKKTLVPSGFANMFEVMVVFVRDDIARNSIGEGYERYTPFLLTAFFWILFGNFLGLIPFSATFTSNIAVTAVLAIFSFLVIQLAGMRHNGVVGYFTGLVPHGIPVFLLPIMAVVEFIGLFTKPFALAIRLFANMTAGHIVIFALIGLIFTFGTAWVSPASVGMALFIYTLEVLIAFIQAYIFTMLSAVFIGMAAHPEH